MSYSKNSLSSIIDNTIVIGATTEDLRDVLKDMVGSYTDFIMSMDTASRNALTPDANMIIFNTDYKRLEYYVNNVWQSINEDSDGLALISASSGLADKNRVIIINTSGGNVTISLPDATTCAGRKYSFIKSGTDGNSYILDGYSAQTINGAATKTYSGNYAKVSIIAYNGNWLEIG